MKTVPLHPKEPSIHLPNMIVLIHTIRTSNQHANRISSLQTSSISIQHANMISLLQTIRTSNQQANRITTPPTKTNAKSPEAKRLQGINSTCVRRFELPTPWSVAKCSIQLSYTHIYDICITTCSCEMPATGVEPVRCRHHRILSPARLPIPPRRHGCKHPNGTYRARTCDPLLVRQMLSQLS